MVVPKSGGKYSYNIDGDEYILTVIDHSMFCGPCTVTIEVDGETYYKKVPYNDLLRFLNIEGIHVKELGV